MNSLQKSNGTDACPPERLGTAALEVADLSFRYPGAPVAALDKVGFRIAPGERVGLLGPNGAGKTTLMRTICGYLALQNAKSGAPTVRIAGRDLHTDSLAIRRQVGYLPELVPLYEELRVCEHLQFRARVKRVVNRGIPGEVERVAELVGLERMLDAPIMRLSRGYRQRVGIADALLGSPALVVLDEPTVGLDPNQVAGIRKKLECLGTSQTLIFSSHMLADVEALCDRVLILSDGKLVADERVQASERRSLQAQWDGSVLDEVRAIVAELGVGASEPGWAQRMHIAVVGGDEPVTRLTIEGPESDLMRRIGRLSHAHGLVLVGLEVGRARLEERFAQVTGYSSQ